MIAKKIFQTGSAQVASLFLGVVTGVFIARFLGPEGRGIFAIFKANIDLLILFLSFGIGSALSYYVSNKKFPIKKILGMGIAGFMASVVLLIIVFTGFNYTYPSIKAIFFPDGYDSSFFQFYIGCSFLLNLLMAIITGILNGRKFFNETNLFKLLHSILLLLGIVFLYYFKESAELKENIRLVFIISLSILFVNLMLLMVSFFGKLKQELKISFNVKREIKIAVGFVYIVYLSELLNFLNYRLDIWLVEFFGNSYQLGIYSLAVSISQMLWLIVAPITIVLMPYFNDSEMDFQSKTKMLVFYSRIAFTLVMICSLFIFLLSDWVIPLVYGKDFAESSHSLRYLLPGIIFSSMTKILGTFILTNGKVKYNLLAVSVGLTFTVLLDLWLIPLYGIIGASIATSVSYFFIFLTCFLIVILKLKVNTLNLFIPVRQDIKRIIRKLKPDE